MRILREENLQEPCGLTYQQLGNLSDEQVMVHLGAGHGDAVAVLLDRYSRLVLSVASQIIHEHAEAEDLTQEVFIELCKTAAQFKADKGTAKMWIIRLAYRRSLNRRRHLKFRNSRARVSDVVCSFGSTLEQAKDGWNSVTATEATT